MSTCARCGLERGTELQASRGTFCAADDPSSIASEGAAVIACRDRELANLRSLLRLATIRLEKGLALLDDINEPCSIRGDLESILEALS